jgi:hypothetical protein
VQIKSRGGFLMMEQLSNLYQRLVNDPIKFTHWIFWVALKLLASGICVKITSMPTVTLKLILTMVPTMWAFKAALFIVIPLWVLFFLSVFLYNKRKKKQPQSSLQQKQDKSA